MLMFEKNQGKEIHTEELSTRSYREDISPPLLKHTKANSDSDREVECSSLFSEAESNQNSVDTPARTHTVEWNNFISKVASKLDIPSTMRSRDSEFKSYITDHLLAPKVKENIGMPLDGSVIGALEEVDSE